MLIIIIDRKKLMTPSKYTYHFLDAKILMIKLSKGSKVVYFKAEEAPSMGI
jgi:hypothetical protein